MSEGYWRAPRRLRRFLEDGDLRPTAWSILHYVAEAGADRDEGFSTSYAALAGLFGVSKKTVERSLESLRELRLLRYETRQGREQFRIYLGDEAQLRTELRTLDRGAMSEVVSEVTSDTSSRSTGREPAPEQGKRPEPTSDISRARAETETETESASRSARASDDDFERAIAPLGFVQGKHREELLDAWSEPDGRDGVPQIVQRAVDEAETSPVAYAARLGRDRAWRERGDRGNGRRDPYACPVCAMAYNSTLDARECEREHERECAAPEAGR